MAVSKNRKNKDEESTMTDWMLVFEKRLEAKGKELVSCKAPEWC